MDTRMLIETAFADTPRPSPPLSDLFDDEGLSDYFTGRTWRGHRASDLRGHLDAMGMFTPEAHRYYLPAFMLVSLENPAEADVIPDYILWHFAEWKNPFWAKRVEQFTADECDAIIAFLRLVFADEDFHQRKLDRALTVLERQKSAVRERGRPG